MSFNIRNLNSHKDIAFYIKWVASIVQIMGYCTTAYGFEPWNIYLFLVGLVGWLIVGFLWHDRAIILIHFVALGAMLSSFLPSS